MRFGNKTRKLAAAGRRFFGERTRDDDASALAAIQEPNATDIEEMVMPPPAPEESMIAGDPTQHLLTALGRFQRQVSRAEEGASQEAWCDECMNQLIVGIEIALNQSWADVNEALTDTARILQTYEDAKRASECVPFLKDSYEILCLMVGDLIVDNVRSGVMKKWRERYEHALDDLANLGLTLVDDGAAQDREEPEETTADGERHAFDTPAPFAPAQTEDDSAPSEEVDAFDALIGETNTDSANEHVEESQDTPPTATESDPFAPVTEEASPFTTPSMEEDASEESVLPSLDELLGNEPSNDAPELALSSDFTADASPTFEPPRGAELAPSGLAPVDESLEAPSAGDTFESAPREDDPAAEAPVVSKNSVEESPVPAPPATDMLVESKPEILAEAPPVPAPVSDPEPEPGTPEALLKTAQEAMARGNVADAKVFALQLAANMARLEAEQVEVRTTEIETRISANVEEVTASERAVSDAEERVRALEEQLTQCQQDFDRKRQHIQQLRDDVSSAESSVADLDSQIAELAARREKERERLAESQEVLGDSLTEESRMQAELDALSDEEGGAQENLESVRCRVRDLQEKGGSHEADLAAARTELAARQSAVTDIEKTIGSVGGVVDGPQKSGDESGAEHGKEQVGGHNEDAE